MESLEMAKPVDRIHWCYLNAEQIKQLQESSVRQNVRQNVTQTVTQNENGDLSFFFRKSQ